MSIDVVIALITVAVFVVLLAASQAVRAWQRAEETIADALNGLDEEGQS